MGMFGFADDDFDAYKDDDADLYGTADGGSNKNPFQPMVYIELGIPKAELDPSKTVWDVIRPSLVALECSLQLNVKGFSILDKSGKTVMDCGGFEKFAKNFIEICAMENGLNVFRKLIEMGGFNS